MTSSIPEDLREFYADCKEAQYELRCDERDPWPYNSLVTLIERIATLTAAKQDVERENAELKEALKKAENRHVEFLVQGGRVVMGEDHDKTLAALTAMQSRAEKAEGERDRLRADLFELHDVVTAENFAEMQQRAERAEAQLQQMQGKVTEARVQALRDAIAYQCDNGKNCPGPDKDHGIGDFFSDCKAANIWGLLKKELRASCPPQSKENTKC